MSVYRGGLVAAVFILVGKGEEKGVDIIITALLRTLCQVAHPPANSLSRFVFLLLISIPVPLVLPPSPVQPPSFFQAESRRRRKGGRGVSTAIARIFMFMPPPPSLPPSLVVRVDGVTVSWRSITRLADDQLLWVMLATPSIASKGVLPEWRAREGEGRFTLQSCLSSYDKVI